LVLVPCGHALLLHPCASLQAPAFQLATPAHLILPCPLRLVLIPSLHPFHWLSSADLHFTHRSAVDDLWTIFSVIHTYLLHRPTVQLLVTRGLSRLVFRASLALPAFLCIPFSTSLVASVYHNLGFPYTEPIHGIPTLFRPFNPHDPLSNLSALRLVLIDSFSSEFSHSHPPAPTPDPLSMSQDIT